MVMIVRQGRWGGGGGLKFTINALRPTTQSEY